MKKKEEKRIPDEPMIREPRKPREKKETPDKNLIEAQLRNEAGDRNRTATSGKGTIEVTALSDPPLRRETRSMPRTSKAVTDALVKKPGKKKTGAAGGNTASRGRHPAGK
ncbi:hypothetical protein EDD80_101548 [Anseongella ginsenosidimutans]|uniref:Uncharacterized protein n=1 Tax=Anseongella ginsenosidimutans TaxID=496056 RepID=A0A4R3KXY4_9SPHI|nr:hypothetical protein [Anseongella ginsenosidimutans]QEC51000.1 hypothetical protein FRZ59_00630 [Anseongella ginsenosidimutans]TCS90348.1 hypothetical protein EDD80_101548 [Anseongella ginsenosidimutans]